VTGLGFALALLIGLALGVLGGGGSILTVPVLHHVLGYPVRLAVPMSLVVVGVTSIVGGLGHWRQGNVELRTAFAFGVPAMLGAVLGADLGLRVADDIRLTIFAIVMLAAAVAMYRGNRIGEKAGRQNSKTADEPERRRRIPGVTLIGAAVGVLTGFVGVGGGFLYVPVLTVLAGLPVKHAIGTSLVLIVLSCAAGIARYLGNPALGSLDWRAIAIFTAIALVGAVAGSRLVPHVSQRHLRQGFAGFLLILGLVVLLVRR
jgi:uncharacterized membrane protein YfcA